MSFIFKGDYGIGTTEKTLVDGTGYGEAADYLVSQYSNGYISNDDKSYDTSRILEYYGAKNLDELRTKRRGW